VLDGLQALRGLLGQAFQVGHHQVGIGLVVAAAHAAAQLVQLRQAELVGAAHHDGVGRGHVDAGLDDGGAQQQVVALAPRSRASRASSSRSGIWPWATAMRASGNSSSSLARRFSMVSTSSCRK